MAGLRWPDDNEVEGLVMRRSIKALRSLLLLLALVFALGACSGGDEDSTGAASDSAEAPSASVVEAEGSEEAPSAPTDAADDGLIGGASLGPTQAGGQERLLRREADLFVVVDDLKIAIDAANEQAQASGGYLSSEESTSTYSQLTLRIPSSDFDGVLANLAGLGELRSQSLTTDDRTEVIVDLEARLESAQASLDRTRTFFDEATKVEELTAIEREVADREAIVASLTAQLDNERSSVSLSTVRITFELSADQEPDGIVEPDDEPLPGVLDAFASGWNVLRTIGYVIFLTLSFLAPWLPIIVALVLAIRWLRPRLAKRRAARPKRTPTPPIYVGGPLQRDQGQGAAGATPPPPAWTAQPPPPGAGPAPESGSETSAETAESDPDDPQPE